MGGWRGGGAGVGGRGGREGEEVWESVGDTQSSSSSSRDTERQTPHPKLNHVCHGGGGRAGRGRGEGGVRGGGGGDKTCTLSLLVALTVAKKTPQELEVSELHTHHILENLLIDYISLENTNNNRDNHSWKPFITSLQS